MERGHRAYILLYVILPVCSRNKNMLLIPRYKSKIRSMPLLFLLFKILSNGQQHWQDPINIGMREVRTAKYWEKRRTKYWHKGRFTLKMQYTGKLIKTLKLPPTLRNGTKNVGTRSDIMYSQTKNAN